MFFCDPTSKPVFLYTFFSFTPLSFGYLLWLTCPWTFWAPPIPNLYYNVCRLFTPLFLIDYKKSQLFFRYPIFYVHTEKPRGPFLMNFTSPILYYSTRHFPLSFWCFTTDFLFNRFQNPLFDSLFDIFCSAPCASISDPLFWLVSTTFFDSFWPHFYKTDLQTPIFDCLTPPFLTSKLQSWP